jgi:hypothetical protein
VETRAGSRFEGCNVDRERFDVVLATPPQTPGPVPLGPKYGGPDGTWHSLRVAEEARPFLSPGGRLWFLAIGLADPAGVRRRLEELYAAVEVVGETSRTFEPAEYDALAPGLFAYLEALSRSGRAELAEVAPGLFSFPVRIFRCSAPRLT